MKTDFLHPWFWWHFCYNSNDLVLLMLVPFLPYFVLFLTFT